MQIITKSSKGHHTKKLCIITGVHGNEAFLFNYLKEYIKEINENIEIKLILANDQAAEKNIRFIDQDLNRAFNSKNTNHESNLAKELMQHVEGDLILDLHTHTSNEQFSLVSQENKENIQAFIEILGMDNSIIVTTNLTQKSSLIENFSNALSIETGPHNSIKAVLCAKDIIKKAINYLEKKDQQKSEVSFLIAKEFIYDLSDKNIIINEKIKNFSKVYKNENLSKNIIANEDFIPVLVSRVVNPGRKILLKCLEEQK